MGIIVRHKKNEISQNLDNNNAPPSKHAVKLDSIFIGIKFFILNPLYYISFSKDIIIIENPLSVESRRPLCSVYMKGIYQDIFICFKLINHFLPLAFFLCRA